MKRRIFATLLLILLILALFSLALSVRIGQDERGAWSGRGPGVEVVYLPARTGPAIWLYLGGRLVWHGEAVRSEPTPTRPGVPVVTPTPARVGPLELEQT